MTRVMGCMRGHFYSLLSGRKGGILGIAYKEERSWSLLVSNTIVQHIRICLLSSYMGFPAWFYLQAKRYVYSLRVGNKGKATALTLV